MLRLKIIQVKKNNNNLLQSQLCKFLINSENSIHKCNKYKTKAILSDKKSHIFIGMHSTLKIYIFLFQMRKPEAMTFYFCYLHLECKYLHLYLFFVVLASIWTNLFVFITSIVVICIRHSLKKKKIKNNAHLSSFHSTQNRCMWFECRCEMNKWCATQLMFVFPVLFLK